ncbi:MAG: decaprenyl-phosphate phosphoribosyltransferase [Ekhidna sp.]
MGEIAGLIIAFFSFSFIASGVYILNDIRDIENDKLHPVKKHRPFASGRVGVSTGMVMLVVLVVLGFSIAYQLDMNFLWLIILYMIINAGYSFGLKSISVLDMLLVSSGFIIRIYMGGAVTGVPISQWLIMMIFLLSLFLVLGKRSDDLRIFEESGVSVRKSSLKYNKEFINSSITMVSGVIIVTYMLYCVSPEVSERWGTNHLLITSIFVIAGIMRYLQLIFVEKRSESPVKVLFKDRFIFTVVLLWGITFGLIIYF